jgi:hypothetical protein
MELRVRRKDVKDISVAYRFSGENWWRLSIVHRKNLLLEEFEVSRHYDTDFMITYKKPFAEKYEGLIVEWLLNNFKLVNRIKIVR